MYLTESARRRGRRRGQHSVPEVAFADTRLSVWEERDRAHVELINAKNDATIIEWWDDDVKQAIEDGFLKPAKLHETAYDYAVHVGLIQRPHPRGPNDPAASIQRSYPLSPPRARENPVEEVRRHRRRRPGVHMIPKREREKNVERQRSEGDFYVLFGPGATHQIFYGLRPGEEKNYQDYRTLDEAVAAAKDIVARGGKKTGRGRMALPISYSDITDSVTVDYFPRKEKSADGGSMTSIVAFYRDEDGQVRVDPSMVDDRVKFQRGVRENPVQARDFDSIDDALAKAPEFLGAEWFVRAGNKVTIYMEHGTFGGRWWEAKLTKARGLYHWPSTWERQVKKLPKEAQPLSKLDPIRGPGGTSREARECGCEHGCSGVVKENPVEVSDGIPWVKTERNAEDFEEVHAVAEKIGEIKNSRDIYNLMSPWAMRQDREHLCVILLDIHNMLRGVSIVHIGTRDRVTVDPGDVLKPAIDRGAKGVAILHNHPTGSAEHSDADASLTKAIKKACDAADITFLDHVVLGANEYFSFADKKLHKVRSSR